jgi:Mg-chelatase subunit ChlD
MKKTLGIVLFAAVSVSLFALDLSIAPSDVLIVQSPEGGYHLYIKKKKDIQSVLLTETTRDPNLKADNYAYRLAEWNAINGDEKRLLDGAFIPPEKKLYSLIDSTPEKGTPVGEAFHVWIPYIIRYGYDWTRNGEVQVLDGTYFNIRAFAKPYADYAGAFADNPYRLRLTQKPVVKKTPPPVVPAKPEPEVSYMKDTVTTFRDLAEKTEGKVLYAKNADDIIPQIRAALEPAGTKPLDLVFVIDATESMKDDIAKMRELIQSNLEEELPKYRSWRVALVLYKDYFEDFMVKQACPFTADLAVFRKALDGFRVQGGRDIPEAVYEGLDGALSLPWNPDSEKKIILIGDAPPHPRPRGRVTKEMVYAAAAEKGVQMNVIILPGSETY